VRSDDARDLELEAATALASLIHEGRATLALRESRKRANQSDKPAAFLLVCGDLCRDLGDIAAAREAYTTLALADHSKAQLAQTRTSELFLSFAERSTAAALQRDDAHFAASGDPAKAIEAYADLVARFPEDASFREELGSLHDRLGHRRAAADGRDDPDVRPRPGRGRADRARRSGARAAVDPGGLGRPAGRDPTGGQQPARGAGVDGLAAGAQLGGMVQGVPLVAPVPELLGVSV